MFSGLDEIDWSSMEHAYGPASEIPALLLALRSGDAEHRGRALSRFYGAVHHQGDVYGCTTASLPFLLELAGDATTPDRAWERPATRPQAAFSRDRARKLIGQTAAGQRKSGHGAFVTPAPGIRPRQDP